MKSFSFVLILLLLSSTFAPRTATAFSLFPFPSPSSLPSIFSGIFSGLGGIFAGIMANNKDNEIVRRCFPDFGDGEACMAEIFGSFFNRAITIGPECCKAIIEIDEDCTQAVFKPFNDYFFSSSVKQFCTYINN